MKTFFRGAEDGFVLKLFGSVHILMLVLWILGIAFIIAKRKDLRKQTAGLNLSKKFILILFIDQIILYTWQFGSGFFKMDMSLPLYHCRIATWILITSIAFDIDKLKSVGVYWGILGSLIAMLIPDLYKFSFPHYTNIQFFLVHIFMAWIVVYLIFVDKVKFSKENLLFAIKFTSIYNFIVLIVNFLLRPYYPYVNYSYLMRQPSVLDFLFGDNQLLYTSFIIIMYNVIIVLIHTAVCILQKSIKRRETLEEVYR